MGSTSEPKLIELGEYDPELAGKQVKVKPRRTFGDGEAIRQATRSALIRDSEGNYRATPQNIAAGNFKALEIAIVEWPEDVLGALPPCSCTDVDAGLLDRCPRLTAIGELDEEIGTWLLDRVEEGYVRPRQPPAAKGGPAAGRARARARRS